MLEVTLLGSASFSANGLMVRSDLGPSGRLLACYLFQFLGRVHRRERLADLFWADAAPDRARTALNTAIWRIRKILEFGSKGAAQHLVTVGDHVVLEEAPSVQVDTHLLESASKRILTQDNVESLGDREIHDVTIAVEGYRGPFLDGHDDDWVLQERERLHCLFVRATFELMRKAAMQGQYERAIEFGRRILVRDALRERVQRDVMLLLVLNGQRAEAIRSYNHFVKLLRSELDIGPMPETKRLHNDILSGDIFGRTNDFILGLFGNLPSNTSN